jgi:ferredoxin
VKDGDEEDVPAGTVNEARWRVTVDPARCAGSAVCVGTAPSRFRLEGGRSQPVDELVEPDPAVLDAALVCPTEAIIVRDGAGNQLAPQQ